MLVNAPLVDQLAGDDVNRQADCASASTAAGLMALVPGLHLGPGDLKDAAYGVAYRGPTDVVRYIPQAAADHVQLTNITGDANTLIATIIAHLQEHHPVLGAIPSQWGLDYSGQDMVHFPGGTHEVCFCDYNAAAGTLTAMNPWPEPPTNNAWYQTQPVDWFRRRLVYGRADILSLIAEGAPTPVLSNTRFPAGVPAGWHDDGATLTAPNKVPITQGFRDEVLKGWDPANVPLAAVQYSNSIQPSDPSVGKGSRQDFLYGSLGWTPARGVFEIPVGHDLGVLASNLQAEMSAADNARAQLASEQQQLDAAHKAVADAQAAQVAAEHEAAALQASLQASLNAANSNVATLTQQVADLKAQLAKAAQQQPPAPAPVPVPVTPPRPAPKPLNAVQAAAAVVAAIERGDLGL